MFQCPFKFLLNQDQNFLTQCTKPSVIWLQPLFPASSSCWAHCFPIHKAHIPVQPVDGQFSDYEVISNLCLLLTLSLLLWLPFPRWVCQVTLRISSQAKPPLWSLLWPFHISSERLLYLKPVAFGHLSSCPVGHIMTQWHSLTISLLVFPDSSSIVSMATTTVTLQSVCSVNVSFMKKSASYNFSPKLEMFKVYKKPPPTSFKVGGEAPVSFIYKVHFRFVLYLWFSVKNSKQFSAQVEKKIPSFWPCSVVSTRNT